jgi:beta-glucanase (GH16 family)
MAPMGIFWTRVGKTATLLAAAGALAIVGVTTAVARIPAGGYLSPATYPGYVLAWRDEFSRRELDNAKWQARDGPARAMEGGALQYDRPGNLTLEDGYLVLTARRESYQGRDYVSASVSTRDRQSFTYGRVDVRARVPPGQGLWPSVRLLGICQGRRFCGAIDVMEIAGGEREDAVYGTLRWPDNGGQRYEGGSITLPNETFDEQFHVYSVIWEPDRIRWLVDDRLYLERNLAGPQFDVFREPFYLAIGLAVGGEWPGSPDASTGFPAQFAIDYVRVFQRE